MDLLLVIVLSSVRPGSRPDSIDPVVADALEDVKRTLAYLSKVTRQTGTAVRSEAIEPLILEHMQRAIGSISSN